MENRHCIRLKNDLSAFGQRIELGVSESRAALELSRTNSVRNRLKIVSKLGFASGTRNY